MKIFLLWILKEQKNYYKESWVRAEHNWQYQLYFLKTNPGNYNFAETENFKTNFKCEHFTFQRSF